MHRVRSILVPTDFSDPASAAWEYARWLATRLQADVHLLHVVSAPMLFDAWGTEGISLRISSIMEDADRFARERLDAMVPGRGPMAARIHVATAVGPTVDRILDYADAHAIDLIVMGTHGRGALGHMLLGSVAERCVHRARVPVLTIHATPKAPITPSRRRARIPAAAPRESGFTLRVEK